MSRLASFRFMSESFIGWCGAPMVDAAAGWCKPPAAALRGVRP